MKKNAFTLIELLAVIIILSVLVTMITPNFMSLFDDKQNTLYNNTIEEVKNVARLYASDNPDVYNKISERGYTYIYINKLCDEKYITCPINNPKDNSNIKGAIKIIYENGKYIYNYVENAPEKFETDSWATIISAINEGEYPYEVGDTKEVNLGTTLGTHTLRITNTTPCEGLGLSSQTACGLVLEFADIIVLKQVNPINDYFNNNWNKGGWSASSLRSYLNQDGDGIYKSFPVELQNAIIDTTVVSGHGNTSGEENFESNDKIYLLSTREVWGKEGTSNQINYDTADGEAITRQLDYYKSIGVSTSNRSGAIKKYNGSANSWWLRSAYSNNDDEFYFVTYSGDNSILNAYDSSGVSPAFRIAN